jgi:hypothetical protein
MPVTILSAPTITSFTPTTGAAGTSVVVTGSNLGGATLCTLAGATCTITANGPTSLTFTVPSGASSGLIAITAPGGTVASATNFTITGTTNFLSTNSTVQGAGANYTLTGAYAQITFGTTSPVITLPTAGTYLIIAQIEALGAAAVGVANLHWYKIYNSTDAADVPFTESRNNVIGPSPSGAPITLINPAYTVTASKTLQLYGYNATAVLGSVISTRTRISYVRLY